VPVVAPAIVPVAAPCDRRSALLLAAGRWLLTAGR